MTEGAPKRQLPRRWLLLTAVAGAAFVLGGLWVFFGYQRAVEREAGDLFTTIAQYKATDLAAWVRDQKEDAAALQASKAFIEPLADFLSHPEASAPDMLLDLLRYVLVSHEVDEVVVLDRDGHIRGAVPSVFHLHGESVSALKTAMQTGRPVMTDVHIDPATGACHSHPRVP